MYSQPAHHAINGFCMLAAGAALQVQLLAVSTCLHKQTPVTSDTYCHKGHADTHQPAVGWGGGSLEGQAGGAVWGDAGTGERLPGEEHKQLPHGTQDLRGQHTDARQTGANCIGSEQP